ncbi:protein UsfY [Mycobacterium sp.]|uniref:protein UsfY n=1 Tax=Mycobacterium sp. TaxID=1785 RepID=UPI003D1098F2
MVKKHDWIDHSRTTQPRSGEWFKNSRDLLGLFLLAAGVVGVPVCLAAAANGKTGWAIGAGIAAGLALSGGAAWLFIEGRRIRRIDMQWHADRRDQRSLPTAEKSPTERPTPLPA